MNNKKFQQKLDPGAKKIKAVLPDKCSVAMRSLAELLLACYERKMAEADQAKEQYYRRKQ